MIFITCSKYWSFGFLLAVFTCPWIITTTVLLVFFVSHIKLVYLAFFLLFKVPLCTHALVLDVFCVLTPCPLDPPLTTKLIWLKLKSDWNQTWFIDKIWEPSYVHAVHTKVKGHLRSGCKIDWKCENGLIWKVEVRLEPNCDDLDQMLSCIIYKPRQQATLAVQGPRSIFFCFKKY